MKHRWQIAKGMADAFRGKTPELPDDAGWEALEAGDIDAARAHAERMLLEADSGMGGWEADDIRHAAHMLLGSIHLRQGDVDGAAAELIRSADVDATAVLRSFGPDLGLAWELLQHGRGDAVVEFAQRFGRFWVGPGYRVERP